MKFFAFKANIYDEPDTISIENIDYGFLAARSLTDAMSRLTTEYYNESEIIDITLEEVSDLDIFRITDKEQWESIKKNILDTNY